MAEKKLVKNFKKFFKICFVTTIFCIILKILKIIHFNWCLIFLPIFMPLFLIFIVILFFIVSWSLLFLTLKKEEKNESKHKIRNNTHKM